MNRPRHRATVCSVVRKLGRYGLVVLPSAQASTIRARSASACDVFARRAHRISCARSASVEHQVGLRPARARAVRQPGHPDSANRSAISAPCPR